MQMLLDARFGYGDLPPWTRWIGDALTMTAVGDALALRSDVDIAVEDHDPRANFTVRTGDSPPFRALVVSVARRGSRGTRCAAIARANHPVVARLVGKHCHHRRAPGPRAAVAAHSRGPHLRAVGRGRRGGHDVVTRGDRRRQKLGLPLRVGARLDVHDSGARPRRLDGRSARVARLGAVRARRPAREHADHVRHQRRTPDRRIRAAGARRLRGFATGAHRERRLHAISAGHLRRNDECRLSRAPERSGNRRLGLGDAQPARRTRRGGVEPPGFRHLGIARANRATTRTPRCKPGARSTSP